MFTVAKINFIDCIVPNTIIKKRFCTVVILGNINVFVIFFSNVRKYV